MIVTSVRPHLFPVVKSRDEANLDRVANKRGSGGPRLCSTGAFITVDKRDSADGTRDKRRSQRSVYRVIRANPNIEI